MTGGNSLNEIVLFEVPARSGATQLLAELSTSRLAWMERGDDVSVIGVLLNPDEDDLAHLLREVETWIGETRAARVAVRVRRAYLRPPATLS